MMDAEEGGKEVKSSVNLSPRQAGAGLVGVSQRARTTNAASAGLEPLAA